MNIKHAQYIMEILKEGSITGAAKALHVSQPALSQTVKAVESFIGAPIFLRNKMPLTLTEAGKRYIEAAKRIITINTNLLNEVNDIKQEESGVLHLGITMQRAMEILPKVIGPFFKAYPYVRLEIAEAGYAETEANLLSGDLDVAVLTTVPTREELNYQLVETEKVLLVANKNTEIAQRIPNGKSILVTEAKNEKFVSITKEYVIRRIQDRLFASNDISPFIILETSSIEVGKKVVMNTDTVFIAPDVYLDEDFLTKNKCNYYTLKGVERKRSCYVCCRKDSYLRKYAQDFIELILKHGREHLRVRKLIGQFAELED